MYSRTTLGNYYPVDSIIHKLNPINKFICFIILLFTLICSMNVGLHLFLFGFLVLVMLLSRVPFKFYFNIIYSLRFILILTVFICLCTTLTLDIYVVLILKIVLFVVSLSIMSFTTSPSELSYAVEKTLTPFNWFFLNLSYLSVGIVNMIKFIPMLITTEYSVLKSVQARGIDYDHSNMISRFYTRRLIFKRVYAITRRRQKDIKTEAVLKLYSHKKYRTNYKVNPFGSVDLLYLLIHLFLIVWFLYEKGLLNEILTKF